MDPSILYVRRFLLCLFFDEYDLFATNDIPLISLSLSLFVYYIYTSVCVMSCCDEFVNLKLKKTVEPTKNIASKVGGCR